MEEELSAAQTTGLEIIMMGDINIDYMYQACSNNKWLNLVQLIDLTQLVTEATATLHYTTFISYYRP